MNRFRAAVFLFLISILAGSSAFAQSTLHCIMEGSWLPVMELKGKTPYCFTGDALVKGDQEKLALLPSPDFGDGFIDVKVLVNKREGVVSQDGALRFTARHAWYRLNAQVSSETDLEDCYFALRFEMYGEVTYYCQPIGSLEAGEPRSIEIYTKLGYEMPQQLHFFSGMEEIRSSLIPQSYRYDGGKFLFASN